MAGILVWLVGNLIAGLVVGLWHRHIMIELESRHPDTWAKLGGKFFPGEKWSASLKQPFWSLKSLFFLLMGKYKKLGDLDFNKRARPLRIVLWLWEIECAIGILLLMFWPLT